MAMPTAAAALLQPSTVATPSSSTPSACRTASAGNAPSSSSARCGGNASARNGVGARQGAEVRARNAEATAPVAAAEGCGRQEPPVAPAVKIPVTCYQVPSGLHGPVEQRRHFFSAP